MCHAEREVGREPAASHPLCVLWLLLAFEAMVIRIDSKEEQRVLQQQAAQEQAEALQREIETAQKAQENLPSFVEGSLNLAHATDPQYD